MNYCIMNIKFVITMPIKGGWIVKKIFLCIIILIFIILFFGCSRNEEEYFIFEGMDKEWSIKLPSSFEKYEEEKEEDFYFVTYKNKKGDRLSINEVVDKDTVIREEIFEKELGGDSYFHIERVQTVDVEGLGKIYYALIEDHASQGHMIYFKMRIKDKVVSFVASKNKPFNVHEEASIVSIISNIKVN